MSYYGGLWKGNCAQIYNTDRVAIYQFFFQKFWLSVKLVFLIRCDNFGSAP